MPEVDLAYFNYTHGGLRGATERGDSDFSSYDYTGLVQAIGDGGRWPHLWVMGEAERYEYQGGKGMWGAVEALRNAGGPSYVPLLCSLPREWGPYAPAIFYDPQLLLIHRWFDHRAPDFAARNRNLLQVKVIGGSEILNVATLHGDINSSQYRLFDAEAFRWLVADDADQDKTVLSVVMANWNETLSGPDYEPEYLDDAAIEAEPSRWIHRLELVGGKPRKPYRRATAAMDYLCGWWNEEKQRRVGGIGFVSACEKAGITEGTNIPVIRGRKPTQIDHILYSPSAARRVVPGSTRVHEATSFQKSPDPAAPRLTHKRLSSTVVLQ